MATDNCVSILKKDDDKRLVFGWASVVKTADGETLEDRQHDVMTEEDLEESVYEYVLNFRDTGEEHIPSMRMKGKLVESCVFTEEKQKAIGIPPGSIPVGWWIGFKIHDDDAWEKIKNGTYKMFSIEGKANRIPVEKSQPTGCGVLVVNDGKILVGTRMEPKTRGQLCGPGGKIEEGETPEEAAKRETKEEFGIDCQSLIPLGVNDDGDFGTSAVFLCNDYQGKPKADGYEMTGAHWLTPEEIYDEDLFPPFEQSLTLLKEHIAESKVAKTFDEILKFNPYHDDHGRFATSSGYKTFSANENTVAGSRAIARHGRDGDNNRIVNVHRTANQQRVIDQWKKTQDFQHYQAKLQTDMQHCYKIDKRIATKVVRTVHSDITSSDMNAIKPRFKPGQPRVVNGFRNVGGYFQTANSFRINDKIRKNVKQGKPWDSGFDAEDTRTLSVMEKGMKPLDKGWQLRRNIGPDALTGMGISSKDVHAARNGDANAMRGISDKLLGEWGANAGYSSAGYDFSPTASFSGKGISLNIYAPKGTKAFVSPTLQESEVVLARNTKLRYTGGVSIDRATGDLIVDCVVDV